MTRWTKSVRDAISIIENVEECLNEMGYHLNIEMYPYQTSGGRGNGISAVFNYHGEETMMDSGQKHCSVSIWDHHSTGDVCLQVAQYRPVTALMDKLTDDHDTPDLMFNYTDEIPATVTIILFLLKMMGVNNDFVDKAEVYVSHGFGGMNLYNNKMGLLIAHENADKLINKLNSENTEDEENNNG